MVLQQDRFTACGSTAEHPSIGYCVSGLKEENKALTAPFITGQPSAGNDVEITRRLWRPSLTLQSLEESNARSTYAPRLPSKYPGITGCK